VLKIIFLIAIKKNLQLIPNLNSKVLKYEG